MDLNLANSFLEIDWKFHQSGLTSFQIEVTSRSGDFFNELTHCDGTDMKIIESSSCRIPLITLMSDPFWLRQRDAISVRVIGHTQNTIYGPVYSTDFLQIPGVPLQPEIPEID